MIGVMKELGMKLQRRRAGAACFLLIFALLSFPVKAEYLKSKPVRILLTALQPATQLEISVYGSYVLNQTLSFQRGSELNVFVVRDHLQVHYRGMIFLAGKEVTLTRHKTEGEQENGLRIRGELNLYPGDLSITVDNGSLVPVLSLPIEEYLLGVVPYEMSDEFPLEALKAQAIAARTYTLANLKPDRYYDLVDNTNDQVFRGINHNNPNSETAVNQTNGLVLTFQGDYARTFYTASNGGFTESAFNAWGRENIPYLQVRPDPHDLENPLSIIKSESIPKSPGTHQGFGGSRLHGDLLSRISQALQESGKVKQPLVFEINRIDEIIPHTTRDGNEKGVMTFLRFKLSILVETSVSTMEDAEVSYASDGSILLEDSLQAQSETTIQKPETVQVDVPVFPDLEGALNLSINRNENEVVSIIEKEDDFLVQFRRYGHGVGLSQRGAEQMAGASGWDYRQILMFYFQGTEIAKVAAQEEMLPMLSLDFSTTPGPVPTATPRPTLMPQTAQAKDNEYKVFVTGISASSSLNLRAQPDFLGEILSRLYYGQELLVVKELSDGWLEVKTDVMAGYIRSEFVSKTKSE